LGGLDPPKPKPSYVPDPSFLRRRMLGVGRPLVKVS